MNLGSSLGSSFAWFWFTVVATPIGSLVAYYYDTLTGLFVLGFGCFILIISGFVVLFELIVALDNRLLKGFEDLDNRLFKDLEDIRTRV